MPRSYQGHSVLTSQKFKISITYFQRRSVILNCKTLEEKKKWPRWLPCQLNRKLSDHTNCHFKSIQQKYNRIEMCGHNWLDGKAYFIILHWVTEATCQTWYECEKDICLYRERKNLSRKLKWNEYDLGDLNNQPNFCQILF